MIGRIQKSVDFCDSHSLIRLSNLHNFVASAYFAFLRDAEVKPRMSAGCQQRRHPWFVHPDTNAIAGHARLSDLKQRTADLVTIADANGVIRQSFDRKIFAELSVDEVG